jgi:hypothetical protein
VEVRGHDDAEVRAGLDVDVGIDAPLADEPQLRKPLQEGGSNLGPFPDEDQGVGVDQASRELIQVLYVVCPHGDLVSVELVEARQRPERVEVVVEDRHLHRPAPLSILLSQFVVRILRAQTNRACAKIVRRPMPDTVDPLILDLLEWLSTGPRPYAEVLDAWRTSCPRLPVWEEANDRGYIERHHSPGAGTFVSVSEVGAEHLRTQRVAASS